MSVSAQYSPHAFHPASAMAAEALPGIQFLDSSELRVTWREDATGTETVLSEGVHYTVGGDGSEAAGTVTPLAEYDAADWWFVERVTAQTQPAEFSTLEPIPPADGEAALDRILRIVQETAARVERTALVPLGETAPPFASLTDLEDGDLLEFRDGALQRLDAAPFAGMFYGGDADGHPTPLSGIGSDAALRTDLAAGTGALVGTEDGTLAGTVTALKAQDTTHTAFNRKISSADLAPIVVPVYWGALLGTGPCASDGSDTTQQLGSTFNGAVVAGAYSAVVVSAVHFAAGMLVSYLGTDGKYHPIVVRTVVGTTLNFDRPMTAGGNVTAAANGAVIGRAYNDKVPHPREYGSNMIADFIADYDYAHLELAYEWKHYGEWTTLGSGVSLGAAASTGYLNTSTGVVGEKSLAVTCTNTATGAQLPPILVEQATYKLRGVVNTGKKSDNTLNELLVAIEEDFGAGKTYVLNSEVIEGIDANYLVEIDFTAEGGLIRPYVQTQSTPPGAGSIAFELGAFRLYRVIEKGIDPFDGPVTEFMDSWGVNAWIGDRLIVRKPQMTLARASVSGNKVSDLRNRLTSDLTPTAPRTVYTDTGAANDGANATVAESRAIQCRQLFRECAALGAQVIAFDGIVGDNANGVGNCRLDLSRQYVHRTPLEDARIQHQEVFTVELQQPVTIAAGAAWRAFILPFNTRSKVMPDLLRFKVSDADVYFYGGYLGSFDPPLVDADLVDSDLIGGVLTFETGKDAILGTPVGRIQTYVAANHTNALPYLFYFRNNDASSQTVTDLVLRVRAVRSA